MAQEYERSKARFEGNPSLQGVSFESFLQERTGMTPEGYRKSANFHREVCLARLGRELVPDANVDAEYKKQMDYYGPVCDVRHILLRGSDDPKSKGVARPMAEARKLAADLMARLDPVEGGRRLKNYLKVLTLEAQTIARACGKSHVLNLEPEDLCALTIEAAAMAEVSDGSASPCPAPWKTRPAPNHSSDSLHTPQAIAKSAPVMTAAPATAAPRSPIRWPRCPPTGEAIVRLAVRSSMMPAAAEIEKPNSSISTSGASTKAPM